MNAVIAPSLVYYLRYSTHRGYTIDSDVVTADVEALDGFIRTLPEVNHPNDVTTTLLEDLIRV